MARYSGKIGFAEQVKTGPGVWEDNVITERQYYGEVLRNTQSFLANENSINDNIDAPVRISVVSNDLAYRIEKLRYVVFRGVRRSIESVDVERPRVILRLGEVYNGPGPTEDTETET